VAYVLEIELKNFVATKVQSKNSNLNLLNILLLNTSTIFRQRAFTSTWTSIELNKARSLNYDIQILEVYHFGQRRKIVEKFDQDKNDFYLQDQITLLEETLLATGGMRLTDHETAGTDVNWDGSVAYLLPDYGTKLRTHIGTGFRAPALFELFGAGTFGGSRFVFGNKDLDPEESISWDVGIDQKLAKEKVQVSSTFFLHDFDEVIRFHNGRFVNVSGAQSLGFENRIEAQIHPNLTAGAFYTYTDAEDENGQRTEGVPEHLWGFDVLVRFLKKIQFFVRGSFKGREDVLIFAGAPLFQSVRIESDSYFKVDAVLSCDITPNTEIYVRAENIFNEEIREDGFKGIPAVVFGGIKVKI